MCHRFEACLIKYGFAERVPEYSYELDGPNGKKIKITTTFRLLPEMAKRILNYDETPIFSNKTCTRRQKNLKSDRIKAGAASKTKEGQSHGTLNAGTSMPDTCDGGRAVSMPNQVRRAVTQAAGAVERCVCFRWLLQLVLASLILSASTRRRLTSRAAVAHLDAQPATIPARGSDGRWRLPASAEDDDAGEEAEEEAVWGDEEQWEREQEEMERSGNAAAAAAGAQERADV